VLNAIRSRPCRNKSDLLRNFRTATAEEMDRILQWCKSKGWADLRFPPTGGRPAESWWPTAGSNGACHSPDNPSVLFPDQAGADAVKEGSNSAEASAVEGESVGMEGSKSEQRADQNPGTSFLPSQAGLSHFYRPTKEGIEILRVLHGMRDLESLL
jgi:hypothetical protein